MTWIAWVPIEPVEPSRLTVRTGRGSAALTRAFSPTQGSVMVTPAELNDSCSSMLRKVVPVGTS